MVPMELYNAGGVQAIACNIGRYCVAKIMQDKHTHSLGALCSKVLFHTTRGGSRKKIWVVGTPQSPSHVVSGGPGV